jgi:protein CpxP
MNTASKNKWLMWLIAILILANIATLLFFWLGKNRKHPLPPGGESAATFIIREAGFDKAQEEQYRELIKQHQEKASALRNEIRMSKDSFFNLLQQPSVNDSVKNQLAMHAAQKTAQLDILTLDHFIKVKAICRPDQRAKFEKIIQDAVHMMGPQPGGPPPPRDGRPPRDGNPPPREDFSH